MSAATEGRKVVIFGTGDFARIAAVYLERDSPHDVVAFTVSEEYVTNEPLLGREVVAWETLADRFPPDEVSMFVAVGFSRVNQARAEIYHEAKARGYELITYVNSKADLWSGNHIGHDATIEDHCFSLLTSSSPATRRSANTPSSASMRPSATA